MLVSQQHALFAEIVPQTAQSLDAVNICVPTQSTILPNNKTLMDTKTAPADKSDECCFFIGIVLFGREVITL